MDEVNKIPFDHQAEPKLLLQSIEHKVFIPKYCFIIVVIGILIIGVAGAGCYYYLDSHQHPKTARSEVVKNVPTTSPSPNTDQTANWKTYNFGNYYIIKYPVSWTAPTPNAQFETSSRTIYFDNNHYISTEACGDIDMSFLRKELVTDIGAGETPQSIVTLGDYKTWYAYSSIAGTNGRYKAVYLVNYKGDLNSTYGGYSIEINVEDANKNSQLSIINSMLQSFILTKDPCPK